jgi:hypothetical protein
MQTHDFIAPSYAELRPLKPQRTATFPVYEDLVDVLVNAQSHPDPTVAHVLATCAAYAYADGSTQAMIMARLGLEENRCRMIAEWVDVMFITSTSFVIQSKDGRVVILCYRGTPPTSLLTWLTDVEIDPAPIKMPVSAGPGDFAVHSGFYRNVRSTRYEIVRALERAIAGRSVLTDDVEMAHPLEALYIAGHSLGGASAAMLTMMLRLETALHPIAKYLKAAYTYGQPMIASGDLARHCHDDDFLRERMIRYVYASDIVPQVPPKASGHFGHFGTEYQYRPKDSTWQLNAEPRQQLSSLLDIVGVPVTFLARQLKLTRNLTFRASIVDHLPQYYIAALTPPGVRSEYGD